MRKAHTGTVNIASALFVVGLLISGSLVGGGIQPAGVMLTSAAAAPSVLFLAEFTTPEAALILQAATGTDAGAVVIKTVRIAIDAREGLRSLYSTESISGRKQGAKSGGSLRAGDPQLGATVLAAAPTLQGSLYAGHITGETYLGGHQVARTQFRYDFIKAPDIPQSI